MAAVVLVAAAMSGCMEVKDFGDFWPQAKPDPALAGHWRNQRGDTCVFEFSGGDLMLRQKISLDSENSKLRQTNPVDPEMREKMDLLLSGAHRSHSVRTLEFRGHKFLLIK